MGMQNQDGIGALLRSWTRRLASPVTVLVTVPWLMVLLVAGTVAQKELGLFRAQEIFFSSWFLWLGPIPLPGAYITLGILTSGLFAKFLFYSPWRWERSGTILTHLGILILLIGGMITALTQKEGFLVLGEGRSANAVSDYHDRVLRVEQDGNTVAVIPFEKLQLKQSVDPSLPFTAMIDALCQNCRPAPVQDVTGRKGLAEQIAVFPAPAEKDNETNMSGVTLSLKGLEDDQDGIYIALEDVPHRPTVKKDGSSYSFIMSRRQTVLPFEIELVDFKKDMHPGTNVARSYSSDVIVRDGEIEWPYHIRMNEPLRYKGYTIYQASFSERPDGEVSILSVVENKGRIFPYLASAIVFLGLMLHVILRLRVKKVAA